MSAFTREALEAGDFRGFIGFDGLDSADVPNCGGVYVVLRESTEPPEFLVSNPGGRFKGNDPTVATDRLATRWVAGCPVVYIGKATSLRSRLRQFRDFGRGRPIGHWGGRYIWQVAGAEHYIVAWKTTAAVPRTVEVALLSQFRAVHGCLPFANINS